MSLALAVSYQSNQWVSKGPISLIYGLIRFLAFLQDPILKISDIDFGLELYFECFCCASLSYWSTSLVVKETRLRIIRMCLFQRRPQIP